MQTLYKFFSASVPHDYFHATQKDLRENIEEGKALSIKELKSLSKTRWCSQAEARDAVVATLGSVIKAVENFTDDAQFIVGFIDTDFIVCLVLFQNILRKCNIAANYLQSTDIDTSKAVALVDALRKSLDSLQLFDEIWQNASTLTNAHEIAAPLEIRRRRCIKDSNQHTWTRRDYKEKLFNKVVKVFVDILNKRFDGSVCDLLRSMASLIRHLHTFSTLTL